MSVPQRIGSAADDNEALLIDALNQSGFPFQKYIEEMVLEALQKLNSDYVISPEFPINYDDKSYFILYVFP